ncbi:hypothetical protein ABKN59_003459 [Abortiporus biennis]
MRDWNSPEELDRDSDILTKAVLIACGVYFWEIVRSMDFEWTLVSGKRKFSWPLIPYFVARYLMLALTIVLLVIVNEKKVINCQALYAFVGFVALACVGVPSILLGLRTISIWSDNRVLSGLIGLALLADCGLFIPGAITKATATPQPDPGCAYTDMKHGLLGLSVMYTAGIELVFMYLSIWQLWKVSKDRTHFLTLIDNNALGYFTLSIAATLPTAALVLVNLNWAINLVALTLGSTIAASCACMGVRQWSHLAITPAISESSFVAFTPTNRVPGIASMRHRSGVHVQMETFTVMDQFESSSPSVTGSTAHVGDMDIDDKDEYKGSPI